MSAAPITPMSTTGTQHIIERVNRESGSYQWARETLLNAVEAKASHVEFGIEWQGVRSRGVYRRMIADDGAGMSPEQLVAFFNTFGAGGKRIGSVHENFGVGAKTSLLPWNRLGVVIISWQRGVPAMIWMMRDPSTGEYGLRVLPARTKGREVLDTVFTPFDDPEYGVDWRKVKPSFIGDHGTVIVLLGKRADQDTVLGDPYREEGDIKGISRYLNHRIWDMAEANARVFVTELRSQNKVDWPRSEKDALARTNQREIHGARHWVEYEKHSAGSLGAQGSVPYEDNATLIDWYLWDGARPSVHAYAPENGFIGVLYKNELYDMTAHHATYRAFGITERDVRARTWIIVRPPFIDPTRGGVYPRTDRNALLYKPPGVGNAARPVPMQDWAAWFARADNFPPELLEALRKARGEQATTIEEFEVLQRLADRFGARWKIEKLRASKLVVDMFATFTQLGKVPEPRPEHESQAVEPSEREAPVIESGRSGEMNTGSNRGSDPSQQRKVAGGLPRAIWRPGSEFEQGIFATWTAHDAQYPEGLIRLNEDHPVIQQQLRFWRDRYADIYAEDVERELRLVYKEVAIAKIAHSEHLKSLIEAGRIEREFRTDGALTLALLGLIAEEGLFISRMDAITRARSPNEVRRRSSA